MELQKNPKTVRQTDFSAGKGNALQACVASLFGLELDRVPNFITADIGYFPAIQQFLQASKYTVRKCNLSERTKDAEKLCLLRGKSPRGSHGHVVVARILSSGEFEFVVDPHPDDTYLDKSENYGWYMVFDENENDSNNKEDIDSDNNGNPHALNHSQDAQEMFDIMETPTADFDMYKDRPVPTGHQKARAAVHKDGDWHRSVHIWLVDFSKGTIALQKRSPNKDTFPNRFDISAAGHVEAGVLNSRETAVRELAEELGIDDIQNPNEELKFAFTCPAEQAGLGGCNCYEDVYFLERSEEQCHVKLGKAEVTAFKWMPIQKLERVLRDRDDEYVPRVDQYLDAFFQYLYAKPK